MDGRGLAPELIDFHAHCESNRVVKLKEFWGIETSNKFEKVKIYSEDDEEDISIDLVSEEEENTDDEDM